LPICSFNGGQNASPYKQRLLQDFEDDDYLDHPDNSRFEEYQDELVRACMLLHARRLVSLMQVT